MSPRPIGPGNGSAGRCALNIVGVAPWEWLFWQGLTKAGMVHCGYTDMLRSGKENGHGSGLNATAFPVGTGPR